MSLRVEDSWEDQQKNEITPPGATEIPEWPKGKEWYAVFNRSRVEKFISGLPKGYLFEAMARLAKQCFTPATQQEEKAQLEYFQKNTMGQIVVGRVLELIGYERKNHSRLGELEQLKTRCNEVIYAYQRYVKDIEYLIEMHNRRHGRIVAEKDYLKATVISVIGDEALRDWRDDRNLRLMNKFMLELGEGEFPEPVKEERTQTRQRTKDGNAGKDKYI